MTRYWKSAGVYHERQRCRRAHATGDRVREIETPDGDPCPVCVDDEAEPAVCTVELSAGGECGRERPCPYHD